MCFQQRREQLSKMVGSLPSLKQKSICISCPKNNWMQWSHLVNPNEAVASTSGNNKRHPSKQVGKFSWGEIYCNAEVFALKYCIEPMNIGEIIGIQL